MSFIALLISYFLQQKLELSLSGWFDRSTLKFLRPHHFSMMVNSRGTVSALILLILAAFFSVFYVLFFFLESLFWGVVALLLEVVLLLLLLGEKGFKERLGLYLEAWNRGDFEAAAFKQQTLSGVNASRLSDPVMMQNEVSSALLYHYFNRFFVIIFWFMAVGPAAAIVVRITDLISQNATRQLKRSATKVNAFIEWLPVRLLALSFALTGDFKGAMSCCFRYFSDFSAGAATVLTDTASGALDSYNLNYRVDSGMTREILISTGNKGVAGIRGLLSRSMGLWLGVFAIIAILGW